jgi:hypothetical protein
MARYEIKEIASFARQEGGARNDGTRYEGEARKEIASFARQEGKARNDIMLRLLCLPVSAGEARNDNNLYGLK